MCNNCWCVTQQISPTWKRQQQTAWARVSPPWPTPKPRWRWVTARRGVMTQTDQQRDMTVHGPAAVRPRSPSNFHRVASFPRAEPIREQKVSGWRSCTLCSSLKTFLLLFYFQGRRKEGSKEAQTLLTLQGLRKAAQLLLTAYLRLNVRIKHKPTKHRNMKTIPIYVWFLYNLQNMFN